MNKSHYNRIKGALGDLGVTNKELAEGLDVTPGTVSTWCTNDKQPSLETLYRIAEYLKVDVRDLLVPNKLTSSPARKK
jgi:putative transcriptional regulator